MPLEVKQKLMILADAAKYDASCASSGSVQRNSLGGKGIGSTSSGMGICHSYAPDGRCISLLKILLTNFCIYDCSYCVNRVSSHIRRARFTVDEVVKLTLDFYKRNYIEGLFLSSGIIQSSDYTMEQLVEVARQLRVEHDFRGYIHLKTIPEASPELLRLAGIYADRLSVNIELPSESSLARLAPEKNTVSIHQSMEQLSDYIDESIEDRQNRKQRTNKKKKSTFRFSPAGQSTQMIVGADNSSDGNILHVADRLYQRFRMRRVYYSAFSPIPDASSALPLISPPLVREHRLYQADWLIRFYGFNVNEITSPDDQHMLHLDVDPKLAWAIRNRHFFPVNINRAPLDALLRIPGVGAMGAKRIVQSRKFRHLRYNDLRKIGVSEKKVAPFIEAIDYSPQAHVLEAENLKNRFVSNNSIQESLF